MKPAGEILLIGYGNELRGDDAIGPRVADAVRRWSLEGVRTFALHQLTPELADPIAKARAAIFVDASVIRGDNQVRVSPIEASQPAEMITHILNPAELLALAQAVFGRSPPAWLVTVPAANLEFGDRLSLLAERGIAGALLEIRRLIAGL